MNPGLKTFPPRLHCLLARDARLGVVFRRGPSNSVCTILWDRTKDTFELGQWLRGRIYERRSDLSADGRYLMYFAMNGRWHTKVRGSWTAISKAPYLKALVLLSKGDCWHGGGLFIASRSYWLNDGYGHAVQRDDAHLIRDRSYQPAGNFGGECPGVYYNRLTRDGWTMIDVRESGPSRVFEKAIGNGLVLRKLCYAETGAPPGNGCYYDKHEIVSQGGDLVQSCPSWQWAELDRKRLVWAENGRLMAGYVSRTGVRDISLLHDFSGMRFEARPAPY